jgi:hypothetical protein
VKSSERTVQPTEVIVSAADGTFYKIPRNRIQEFRIPENTIVLAGPSGAVYAIPRDQLTEFQMGNEEGLSALRLQRAQLRQQLRALKAAGIGPPRFLGPRRLGFRRPFRRGMGPRR